MVLSQNLIHIQNRFNDIIFDKDMLKIIPSLYENKTHGHDGIPTRMLNLSSSSIIIPTRMLKLSSSSIIKPFSIIFQNRLKSSIFPDDWKRGNILPVHKKTRKQLVNN